MTVLRPRLSRALALLLLFAGIAVGIFGVILPIYDSYAAARSGIDEAAMQIERYRRIADRLPQQRAELAALKERSAAREGFLVGTNETLTGAELQSRLKTMIEAAQGVLRTTQLVPAREEGAFRRITLRGEMTVSLAAAQAILYQIESMSPSLFFESLDLRPHPPEHGSADDESTLLDVSFEVFGYTRGQQ